MAETIAVTMCVKNEDCFVWYALMSVVDWADKILIYDTGSDDNTVKIIQSVIDSKPEYKEKITFEERGPVTKEEYKNLRQEQYEKCGCDWAFVVDGDEIWWKESLDEMRAIIERDKDVRLIGSPFYNCCGDVFHYRKSERDVFILKGYLNDGKETPYTTHGAFSCHCVSKKIPGIHCNGNYGIDGKYDIDNDSLYDGKYKMIFTEGYFLHTSYCKRSSSAKGNFNTLGRRGKYLLGYDYKFDSDFKFPEVFYRDDRPSFVPSPFDTKITVFRRIANVGINVIKKIRNAAGK